MRERTIYECEFCRSVNHPKRRFSKYAMAQHEDECFYNPKNRTCMTCANNEYLYGRGVGKYGIGCSDGDVDREEAANTPLPEYFRHFKCDKYEYDNGNPPKYEAPWYPSSGEDGSTYAMGGSFSPGPWEP